MSIGESDVMIDLNDLAVLDRIESLTRYPSIPTYHALCPDGDLLDTRVVEFEPDDEVVITEKVDGANARIIFAGGGGVVLVGSRTELLWSRGDRLRNPELGIVDALRDLASYAEVDIIEDTLTVFYLEVYGVRQLPAWKQYGDGEARVALFDCATVWDVEEKLSWSPERVAGWRDRAGPTFYPWSEVRVTSTWEHVNLVPEVAFVTGVDLPVTVDDTHEWLKTQVPHTLTQPDVAASAAGCAEGVVVRTKDRTKIAKIRYANYERAARLRAKHAREERDRGSSPT